MPARQENSLTPDIHRLGIIAGGGVIPRQLRDYCHDNGIQTSIVGIRNSTNVVPVDYWGRIGSSGKIIRWLKQQGVRDIVLIGAVKRPTIVDLWPDWITAKFFIKAWLKSFGDNDLLKSARKELESMGFKIHGIHKFLPDLLMPEGALGIHLPSANHYRDIQIGIRASQELGAQDKGQAVLVKDGQVIAREDKKGTSKMIEKYGCTGAVLVKTCKPQQDRDMDLPTLGAETLKHCAVKNMAGIAGQAGHTLLVERQNVCNIANEHSLFVVGVTLDDK